MRYSYHKLLNAISSYFQQNIDDIKYDGSLDINKLPLPDVFKNIQWQSLLEPPPLNSSEETLKELQELSDITNNIDDNDRQLIMIVDNDPVTFFIPVLKQHNIVFPREEFDKLYKPVYDLIKLVKVYFNRPRPNQLASKLGLKINIVQTKTHQTPSYPSGHTAYAALAKELILHKFGDQVPYDKINRVVRLVGEARMKQGVHYRSDIAAAEKLISLIFPQLIEYYG